jgi:hypothetical protein
MKKLLWPHHCHTVSEKTPRRHSAQRGQAVLLVAVSLSALIGLAALAIDVATLYVARSEAEKTADQAALAGAKAFVSSGFTSGGLGDWTDGGVQSTACNGASGLADLQAQAVAKLNPIAGAPATTVATACDFTNPEDPQITVTVQRTGLPNFFSRIWSPAAGQVTAVSKAEAFNPSGSTTQIAVANVKPWLVANCDTTRPAISITAGGNPACPGLLPLTGRPYLLNPSASYAIVNNGAFTGSQVSYTQLLSIGSTLLNGYVNLNVPISPSSVSCPSTSAVSCGGLSAGSPGFTEAVACGNSAQLSCGLASAQGVTMSILTPIQSTNPALCLTHASDYGLGNGQDVITPGSPSTQTAATIAAGYNNPDYANLSATPNVSRSDSVVTVPIWDGQVLCVGCDPVIVGFMQLAITQVPTPVLTTGTLEGVILNVAGCGSATGTAVAGGGTSPIPVRLVR